MSIVKKITVKITGTVFGLDDADKLDEEHYYLPVKQARHLINAKVAVAVEGKVVALAPTKPKKPTKAEKTKSEDDVADDKDVGDGEQPGNEEE